MTKPLSQRVRAFGSHQRPWAWGTPGLSILISLGTSSRQRGPALRRHNRKALILLICASNCIGLPSCRTILRVWHSRWLGRQVSAAQKTYFWATRLIRLHTSGRWERLENSLGRRTPPQHSPNSERQRRSTKLLPPFGKLSSAMRTKPENGQQRPSNSGTVGTFNTGRCWLLPSRAICRRERLDWNNWRTILPDVFQKIHLSSSTTCRLSGHKWQSTTMIPRRPSSFFKPPLPMNWGSLRPVSLLCILFMYEEKLIFHCIRAAKQPPSFKKSSTIVGLCGTSPSGHWHTGNWAGHTCCKGMAPRRRVSTESSLPFGKMPTPTSPS